MEASAHRANAREALRGNWVVAVLVTLLANVIGGGFGSSLKININLEGGQLLEVTAPEQVAQFMEIFGIAWPLILLFSGIMLVVSLLLTGVAQLGHARYCLNLIDRSGAVFEDVFSGIPRFVDALVMHLLRTVLTAVGMLLFVVPGIILTYSYAMAPYILAEDPACTASEALRKSRMMMQGHKLELFWLELTFIGWEFLAAFTLGIGALVLNPYKATAKASFYRNLTREYLFG